MLADKGSHMKWRLHLPYFRTLIQNLPYLARRELPYFVIWFTAGFLMFTVLDIFFSSPGGVWRNVEWAILFWILIRLFAYEQRYTEYD